MTCSDQRVSNVSVCVMETDRKCYHKGLSLDTRFKALRNDIVKLWPLKVFFVFFNDQSTISVISGRNTIIYLIISPSVHSSRHFTVFVWRGFGENEVE